MAKITMTKPHNSGIALGGIGSGTVELLPDGEFHYWQIANPPRLTQVSWENHVDDGEGNTGALSFWVRSETPEGKTVVRKLGMKTDPDVFTYRMFAWNKPVERIAFNGRFPVCDLDYLDAQLPCKISLRAVSPFVPHNSDISATPGYYMDFTLENPTDETMSVSLLGTLEPNFANDEGCQNELIQTEDSTAIYLKPAALTQAPNCGNLCLSISNTGSVSYITGENWRYLREYIHHSNFGVSQESVIFDFRDTGMLSSSAVGVQPEAIPEDISSWDDETVDSFFHTYCAYPFADSLLRRIRHLIPAFPADHNDKREFLISLRQQLERMRDNRFGACALCSKVELAPGEKKTVRFVLSWYFPNHFNPSGRRLGHYYENLYANALEANRFLVQNAAQVYDKAVAFADLLFDTDMPDAYPECWSSHLSTLVKCSWYLQSGKFALWEGLGFCGFHTTDITYHASFSLVALFPDLQLKQMKMGAAFQREDGRVHHFFRPDLDHVDNGFDRVDMNNQFVLMVLRDYLYTGDMEYLTGLWGNVCRAMDSIQALDWDGDGLPDHDTKRNTYDAWNFSGTPTYIAVLWLAALKAASLIADRLGEEDRASAWRSLLAKGKVSLDEKLWNGEYYNLWRDEHHTDEALMSDQLDGEWFLHAAGIGGNLPIERTRDILKLVFDRNFIPDNGLINATSPSGKYASLFTYKNCQIEAVWTGIGYAVASLCLYAGLRDQADLEIQTIQDNQMRFGAMWDHWECGHHYSRPMSSWTTLNAALGLRVDVAGKTIRLDPIADNIRLPLCLNGILATVTVKDGVCSISCIEGDLTGWKVFFREDRIK